MDTAKPVDNHRNTLPLRIREWLNKRGLTDGILALRDISYDGRIVIPIKDFKGNILFRRYRRDPSLPDDGPKYTYEKGSYTALFPIENLSKHTIIICEGEFDAMILESKGFNAITSTGGAMSFQEEWKHFFEGKNVYVVFDNDKAGREGIMKVCRALPHAMVIPLPPEVGEHGDVTDFFVKLHKNEDDFRRLMGVAYVPEIPKEPAAPKKVRAKAIDGTDLQKAKQVPIKSFIKTNSSGFAQCPFHGKDSTPSFQVYDDNHAHCFGCPFHGDVIDFIVKRDNLRLTDAVKYLLQYVS